MIGEWLANNEWLLTEVCTVRFNVIAIGSICTFLTLAMGFGLGMSWWHRTSKKIDKRWEKQNEQG